MNMRFAWLLVFNLGTGGLTLATRGAGANVCVGVCFMVFVCVCVCVCVCSLAVGFQERLCASDLRRCSSQRAYATQRGFGPSARWGTCSLNWAGSHSDDYEKVLEGS